MRAKPQWPEKATWMQQRVSVEGAGEKTHLCFVMLWVVCLLEFISRKNRNPGYLMLGRHFARIPGMETSVMFGAYLLWAQWFSSGFLAVASPHSPQHGVQNFSLFLRLTPLICVVRNLRALGKKRPQAQLTLPAVSLGRQRWVSVGYPTCCLIKQLTWGLLRPSGIWKMRMAVLPRRDAVRCKKENDCVSTWHSAQRL